MQEVLHIPVLFAFEEDIRNRSWLDWISAHISFMKPLHRYEGEMRVEPLRIILAGTDKKGGDGVLEVIGKQQLIQLYHGFDNVFSMGETRSLGLGGMPLRLTYVVEEGEKKIYLISNYRLGSWNNLPCFEMLKNWAG